MQLISLRQLILLSYLIALLPLGMLLWQNHQSLSELADIAEHQAKEGVELTRSTEAMRANAIGIERAVRQYLVLEKPEGLSLIWENINRFEQAMQSGCEYLQQPVFCDPLQSVIGQLKEVNSEVDASTLETLFEQLRSQQKLLADSVAAQLDSRLSEQQQQVNVLQRDIAWQTLFLVLVTLLMVWWASQLVLKPFQQLQRMINAIGEPGQSPAVERLAQPKELVELEQRLLWLAQRLEQLESVRHAMLRHASHELKTPLASIKEGCSLLADQVVGKLNQSQAEVVTLLEQGTLRLTELIEQLLDYNRLLQQSQSQPQQLSFNHLLTRVEAQHQLALTQKGMSIHYQGDDVIHADKELLQRILDNLINNAIAYGARDSVIDIHIQRQQDESTLKVCNACEDLSEQPSEILFEPFQRGQQQRQDGLKGSGLGLSIVADCARIMGGHASILSENTGRFCIQIQLPQEPAL